VESWSRRNDTKKLDSLKVTQLRTNVLMETDFKFLNKIIGKRVMKWGDKMAQLPKSSTEAGSARVRYYMQQINNWR
jgi:hypothetical protein